MVLIFKTNKNLSKCKQKIPNSLSIYKKKELQASQGRSPFCYKIYQEA